MVTRLIGLVLIVSMASLALVACDTATAAVPTPQPASPPPPPRAPTPIPTVTPTPIPPGEGTEVTVDLQEPAGGSEYSFSPADMTFSVGDVITFVLTSQTEFHTFTVDDLEIDLSIDSGVTVKHTFKFTQAGTFSLICIPHELQGMVGTITVK